MKRLLLLLALCLPLFAQQVPPQRNSYGPLSQGGTVLIPNTAGSQSVSFEYLYSATPASASITIQGCMRGKDGTPGVAGTCDTAADTYTGTTNSIRSPSFSKVYDTFLITAGTLSAGTTLTVNTTVVVSKAGTSGGSISGTLATGGNPGPVPYVSAANTLSEDATNFCWDATNHRLGLGPLNACTPTAGQISVEYNDSTGHIVFNTKNNGIGGVFNQVTTAGGGGLFCGVMNSTGTDWTNGIARAGYCEAQSAFQLGAGNSSVFMTMQTNGHTQINTTTDPGASIFLTINGDQKWTHSVAGGIAPTISSGAGTGATIAGSDESGRITVGTTPGNTIVVNLGQTYTNAPECLADDETQLNIIIKCVGATGTLTLKGVAVSTGAATNFVASDVVKWRSGGH